eukprot:6252973-Alexandrium_andersonii.AAC.1
MATASQHCRLLQLGLLASAWVGRHRRVCSGGSTALPTGSRRFQQFPAGSSRFHQVPEGSSRFQKVPEGSSRFQQVPA